MEEAPDVDAVGDGVAGDGQAVVEVRRPPVVVVGRGRPRSTAIAARPGVFDSGSVAVIAAVPGASALAGSSTAINGTRAAAAAMRGEQLAAA